MLKCFSHLLEWLMCARSVVFIFPTAREGVTSLLRLLRVNPSTNTNTQTHVYTHIWCEVWKPVLLLYYHFFGGGCWWLLPALNFIFSFSFFLFLHREEYVLFFPPNVDSSVRGAATKVTPGAVIRRKFDTRLLLKERWLLSGRLWRRSGLVSGARDWVIMVERRIWRWHPEEAARNWSSGALWASSCAAPHPKPGIYSGGMSGSGGWQVSSPHRERCARWSTAETRCGAVSIRRL